jgi:hypothetical protein
MYYPAIHSTSSSPFTSTSLLLEKPICAIQLLFTEKGEQRLGLLAQLASGTNAEICGPGFNERTVKVRANGQSYFVFVQDIQATEAFGASS